MVRGEICYVFMEGGDTGEEWVVKKPVESPLKNPANRRLMGR